jgi:hypothetical protein
MNVMDASLFRPLTRREREELVARGHLDLSDPRIRMGHQPELFVNKVTGSISVTDTHGRVECLGSNIRQSGFRSELATFPIKKRYAGEDSLVIGGATVKYLTPSERESYRLTVKDGKLYDASGQLFDTGDASNFDDKALAIFVMDAEGNLFASKTQEVGVFHHSSLLAGASVAAAGEMAVEQGVLKRMTRKSGHYHPRATGSRNVQKVLAARGLYLGQCRWEKGWEHFLEKLG